MEVYGNVIAINYGSEVLFINNSGWLIKDYTSYQEVQSVVLSNNVAGIVYKNKNRIFRIIGGDNMAIAVGFNGSFHCIIICIFRL